MKPTKQIVPLSVGVSWTTGGLFQQKMDGRFALREVAGGTLAGEEVHGEFITFDCLSWRGADVRCEILAERIKMRNELCRDAQIRIVTETTERGGEFLEYVLRNGGEGVVRKELSATYFSPMVACKRFETWICRVAGFNGGKQSVSIVDNASGQGRGNVALLGGRCDRVRIGSILKIEGFGIHKSGLIREPRICKDTPTSWLVNF